MDIAIIQSKIYDIRGQKVMLDFELAELYQVSTKALNQAVKRNLDRFPAHYMFSLKTSELRGMRSQFVTASQQKRNHYMMPYAFTEHGIAMLASVLKSKRAIQVNIEIIDAFVALRRFAGGYKELEEKIRELQATTESHSEQLTHLIGFVQDAANQNAWEGRQRIGFNNPG